MSRLPRSVERDSRWRQPRKWVAALAVLALVFGLANPASAWQTPTSAATTSGTLGTPSASATLTLPNGVTETITGGAGTGIAQTAVDGTTTLGGRGYVASDYPSPALASSTPAVDVVTDFTNNCTAPGTCSGLGSLTIRFSSPVIDPVIAIGGICGNFANAGSSLLNESQLCDVLKLTSPGATLSKIAGSNLSVTGGNTITPTNPNGSYDCSTTSQGGTALPSQAVAACGEVQVLGTVTSLTFSVSGVITTTDTTGTVPGYSCTNDSLCQDGFAIVAIPPNLSLSLTKTANPTTVSSAGQQITYSYRVTNTGDLTMSSIVVNETAFSGTGTMSAISCPSSSLAPGASETCTSTYTVTQADLAHGRISNTATATGTPPSTSPPLPPTPPSSVTITVPAPTVTDSPKPTSPDSPAQDAPAGTRPLAYTGTQVAPMTTFGLGLLLTGGLLLAMARRRRRRS